MRTTVDLPDPLFRELKALAARRGVPLKELIRAAVEAEIRKAKSNAKYRVIFPLLPSSKPGALDLTNVDVEDLLA